MTRILISALIITSLSAPTSSTLLAQKSNQGIEKITSSDLQSYVSFLASPLLEGRANGEPGLEIASEFIATQAKLIGLKPANEGSYFQPYSIIKKSIDMERTSVEVITDNFPPVTIKEQMYQLFPAGAADFELDGEVVFAGYGIKADKYNYNDLENITTEGKIILIMNRAPLSEDGNKFLFEEKAWESLTGLQWKLSVLMFTKAKAILMVTDPKSGFTSFDQQYPGISNELRSSKYLKGSKPMMAEIPGMPRMIFVHRKIADELLKGTGHSLEELQKSIDSDLKPHSFVIPGKKLKIKEVSLTEEIILNNVVAVIEGSDPELRNEVLVMSAHTDHIGASGGLVNAGADDDASGCAALLEIAEAFQSLDKKPLRSILFLWVSGEEIGLYGSQSYVNNPLFPLEKTVANLNIDMIGRVKGVADSTSDNPMSGPSGLFIITGNQSKELVKIADDADKRSPIDFDYSLSGRNNPLQLFARSDHYNFVKKDIPVLFFTTGLHTDYHTPGDVPEKIDYKKMENITKTIYEIGFTVANRKTRLTVDNPFSKW